MKTIILLSAILVFCSKGIAQENNYDDLYRQALDHYFNPVAYADVLNNKIYSGSVNHLDTIIVRKEKYLPDFWPDKIGQHIIKYLSREEINNFEGRFISLMTLSPIRETGRLYLMRMTNYHKAKEGWSSQGYHEFRFTFNPKTKKYDLSQPIITFCNSL